MAGRQWHERNPSMMEPFTLGEVWPPLPRPEEAAASPRVSPVDAEVHCQPSLELAATPPPAAETGPATGSDSLSSTSGAGSSIQARMDLPADTQGVPRNCAAEATPPVPLCKHARRRSLHRVLGWPSLLAMGIGSTIGAGIFVLTGLVARNLTGPALALSFVVAAVACAFSGLCYAEFAALAPSAGSAYAYCRATMPQWVAWLLGWNLVLEYSLSAAVVAQSWSNYLNEALGMFNARMPDAISSTPFGFNSASNSFSGGGGFDLPALLISLLITAVLVCGVRESARFNNFMVILKVIIVLFVIVLGATLVEPANWHPFAPFGYAGISIFGQPLPGQQAGAEGGAGGVLAGAALVFFSFIGFDSVSCQAEEARKPSRDLPVAILGSLAISTALYVGVAAVLTGMVSYRDISVAAPLSVAFTARGMHWAGYIVALGAIVGIMSVLLVTLMSQARIFLAMARDGLLPPFFSNIHPTFRTPWKSTMLTGAAVGVLGSCVPMSILAEMVSIGTLSAFAFVCVAVLLLRRSRPDLHRPFKCPGCPLVPLLGVLCCLTLMFSLPAPNWYRLIGWMLLGGLIYIIYGRKYGIGHRHRLQSQRMTGDDDEELGPGALADVIVDRAGRNNRPRLSSGPSEPVRVLGRTSFVAADATANPSRSPPQLILPDLGKDIPTPVNVELPSLTLRPLSQISPAAAASVPPPQGPVEQQGQVHPSSLPPEAAVGSMPDGRVFEYAFSSEEEEDVEIAHSRPVISESTI